MKNWHFGHEGLPSKAQKNFQSHRLVAVVIDLLCRHFGRHVVLAWSLHYTYSGALLKRSLMSCNMDVMSWLARKLRHGDLQKEIHPRKKIIIGIRQSVAVSLRKKKRRNERLFEIFNAWNRFSLLYICLVQFFSKIGRRPSKEKKNQYNSIDRTIWPLRTPCALTSLNDKAVEAKLQGKACIFNK